MDNRPPQKPSGTFRLLGCGGLLLGAVILAAVAGQSDEDNDDTAPTPAASSENSNATQPDKDDEHGDGVYRVGDDITPGTWKTSGPEDSNGCYWERARNASGETDSIIANNLSEGPGVVAIAESDAIVSFSGGCTWTLAK